MPGPFSVTLSKITWFGTQGKATSMILPKYTLIVFGRCYPRPYKVQQAGYVSWHQNHLSNKVWQQVSQMLRQIETSWQNKVVFFLSVLFLYFFSFLACSFFLFSSPFFFWLNSVSRLAICRFIICISFWQSNAPSYRSTLASIINRSKMSKYFSGHMQNLITWKLINS